MTAPLATTTRAYWATGPLAGELRSVALRRPGPDEVLVATQFSGISRGTEALVAAGEVPASERERMRCPFQEGEFPFPVKYGYSAVGVVEDGPAELCGREVFCLHPHQERFVVPVAAVTPLPDGVPPGRAVLAANTETALNALWDGQVLPGDCVVVVGAGVVGSLVAFLASRIPGCAVTLVDIDERKRALAAALGVGFSAPPSAPREADLVIEASGRADALAGALELAGFEATVLALGWYGTAAASLPLGEAFHSRRLRLVSSQVGHVAGRQRARWSHERRRVKALQLLRDPVLDRLIDGESAFDELPTVLPRLARDPRGVLCRRIRYD
jgi:2-desacetyl-2-hydroxyethyl bacteriochlorophyllide A dehydrogenase